MEFVVDSPPASEDSDTPASTIHNYIQDEKTAIRERIEANNGDFYEHGEVIGGNTPGEHRPSRTAFVKVHDTLQDAEQFNGKANTLHYIRGQNDENNKGVYYIDNDGSLVRVGTFDHSLLDDLDDPSCHSFYLLIDGSRAMSADLNLGDNANPTEDSYGGNDHNPLEDSHADKSWYDAHGSSCILARHFPNGEIINDQFDSYRSQESDSDELFAVGDTVGETLSHELYGNFPDSEFPFFPRSYGYVEWHDAHGKAEISGVTLYSTSSSSHKHYYFYYYAEVTSDDETHGSTADMYLKSRIRKIRSTTYT